MTSRKTVLETINRYSIELYYLLGKRKVKPQHLYNAIIERDKEVITEFIIPINKRYLTLLKEKYNKEDILDEILYLTDNRFYHLKEINNIVNISDILEEVIDTKIYNKKIQNHYTDLILDILVEYFYDKESIKIISKLKRYVLEEDRKLNMQLINNIDNYYIRRITI